MRKVLQLAIFYELCEHIYTYICVHSIRSEEFYKRMKMPSSEPLQYFIHSYVMYLAEKLAHKYLLLFTEKTIINRITYYCLQ